MNSRHDRGFLAVLFALLLPFAAQAGLVSYWNFDNAGSLGADVGPSGNALTAFNGASYSAAGKNGGCLQLNGGSQYLGPAAGGGAALTNLPIGNSTYTLAAWIKPTASGARGIIGWGSYGTARAVNALRLHTATTNNAFRHYWWAADLDANPASPDIFNGQWHHIAAVYNGATRTLYLDGVQIAQDSPGANNSTNLNFRIGSTNNGEYFSGAIDDVAVWNSPLSLSEVQSLAGGALPSSVGGTPVINTFTASPSTFLPGQSVTLTWATTQATTVSIDQGIGSVATSGSVTLNPNGPTTYVITANNAIGPSTAQVTVTPYAPVQLTHRYQFSEAGGAAANGAQVSDTVGTAHGFIRGTGANFTGSQVTLPGGASGTAPYVDLPNGLLSSNNEVTFEGWMTISGSQNWSRVFDFGTSSSGEIAAPGGGFSGTEYLLISAQIGTNQGAKRLAMRDNNVEQMSDINDLAANGQQFHFAVVYSATANNGQPLVSYYKDGVFLGSLATTYRLQNIIDNNNWLGRSNFSADNNTQGSYNEFRIWNGVLPASAISDNFGAGPDALPTAPRIDAFTALPSTTVNQGDSVKLSYVMTNPSGGPVTGSIDNGIGAVAGSSGFVTVTPAATTTYTLTATTAGGQRTAQVTVTVVSSAPVASNANVSTFQETSKPITLVATDPNTPIANLTYTYNQPAHGTVTGPAPNVTYTPTAGYTGTDSFTWKANDGTQDSNTATISITVLSGVPIANNNSGTTPFNTPINFTLTATDPDTPVGNLTYSYGQPAHGAVSGVAPNVTYTPAVGYAGLDSFLFTANDGTHTSTAATISITVLPPPTAPTGVSPSDPAIFTDAISGSFISRLQAVDPNPGDTHTFALVTGAGDTHNGYFTIVGNQLISSHNFSGDVGQNISVRIRVTDNTDRTFDQVLTLAVQAAAPHVKINEIHYNSARNTQLSEFIELYNPTPAAVDLSGWRFNSGVNYVFPAGTTIPTGGYVVIAKNPATIAALYGVTALGPWEGGLDSQGEEIILRDTLGNKIDGVDYGISSPWPATPNGDGPTLELIHPSLDNDFGGDWRASTLAPTAVNYVTAGSAGWHYRKGTSEASAPVDAWRGEAFAEDGTWLTGTAPIGLFKQNNDNPLTSFPEVNVTLATLLTDMATYSGGNFITNYKSVFFRRTFTATSDIPKQLLLRVMHNDAAVVWINGVEVARFGFPPGATGDPAFNTAAHYERGNDPWSELVITNANNLLHSGTNTLAIQGFAKLPVVRSQQDDPNLYNIFDFSIDASLTNVPELLGTPGAQNSVFSTVSPPSVRDIKHSPSKPTSAAPITVSARVSDPQGVGAVTLSYQICAPGNFIPSTLPYSIAALQANPYQPLAPNPAFENVANWTTINMVDDGSLYGDVAGDGVFTAQIPAQPHRTLVRYRITAADLGGQNVRLPATDDPRLNFACFVYDGVPAYGATSAAALNTLPAYHWITRASDFSALLAYNGAEQFPNTNALYTLLARKYENWEGALVVGDEVIDHTLVRLRGGNSRYQGAGKRHFRFKFPKGTPLQAEDNYGNKYPRKWEEMLFNKLFGNKGYYDWGLTYHVGGKMWELSGVPIPQNQWVHFRVIRNVNENDAAQGDFWGLYQALELPEGKNFLAARDLPNGNFYKLSDFIQNGEMDERYQAAGAVDFAEDFDNIRYNIHQGTSQADMEKFIHMPLYYRYNAVQEAIRHYDLFVEPTGRHRVKNLVWWFEPQAGNPLGRCLFMPYDWDASFGPNWNSGYEMVQNALFNYFPIPDSPTWTGTIVNRAAMQIQRRNAVRELRDLLVYRDGTGRGPMDDIIDDAAAKLAAFWPADRQRWPTTGAQNDSAAGPSYKVTDMKNFLFTGWTDPSGNGDPAVGAGGRAAYLTTISDSIDSGQLPNTPTITDASAANHPVDGLAFTSSAFSDPQGAGSFAAMQWRIGEVTDPTAPAYDATAARIYEMTTVWTSGELAAFNANVTVPGTALRVGHTYRARVRHQDNTGRWSHWSPPVSFTTTTSNYTQVLHDNLVVAEFMYHPAAPNAAEIAAGYLDTDFEWIELRNVSTSLTLDLANVRFTKGVDFDFAGSAITSLAPGASVLVVRNLAAFTMRHGPGKPVAGEWETGDGLSDAGEQIKLSYGAGAAIHDFTYDDNAPWPAQADAGGYSLVLRSPQNHPDHAVAANWRASSVLGGTPGVAGTIYSEWAAANGVTTETSDPDNDALSNQLEYGLGLNPNANSRALLPTFAFEDIVVSGNTGKYLTYTFRRVPGAEDLTYSVEYSTNFTNPGSWLANGVLVSSTPNADGTTTETWRSGVPITTGPRMFARLRITKP
jgi:hypothetical protein